MKEDDWAVLGKILATILIMIVLCFLIGRAIDVYDYFQDLYDLVMINEVRLNSIEFLLK